VNPANAASAGFYAARVRDWGPDAVPRAFRSRPARGATSGLSKPSGRQRQPTNKPRRAHEHPPSSTADTAIVGLAARRSRKKRCDQSPPAWRCLTGPDAWVRRLGARDSLQGPWSPRTRASAAGPAIAAPRTDEQPCACMEAAGTVSPAYAPIPSNSGVTFKRIVLRFAHADKIELPPFHRPIGGSSRSGARPALVQLLSPSAPPAGQAAARPPTVSCSREPNSTTGASFGLTSAFRRSTSASSAAFPALLYTVLTQINVYVHDDS
jgi:hypothetical protein